jgi:hypothetical protein
LVCTVSAAGLCWYVPCLLLVCVGMYRVCCWFVLVCTVSAAGLCWYVPCLLLVCLCRILQTESEALSCDDGVLLDLNQLLDIRLQQAVALR